VLEAGRPRRQTLVALGDSYSSGEGAPPFLSGPCDRSPRAWPALLPGFAPIKLERNIACSGATTRALSERFKDQPPQLQELSHLRADLITITIGGNDADFGGVLTDCVLFDCLADGRLAVERRLIGRLGPRLESAFKRLRADAHGARVYVVGYPRLFPMQAATRGACGWLSNSERQQLNAASNFLQAVQQRAADKAGAGFISSLDVFRGHELCSGRSWVYSLGLLGGSLRGHPTLRGQQALAERVAAVLDRRR